MNKKVALITTMTLATITSSFLSTIKEDKPITAFKSTILALATSPQPTNVLLSAGTITLKVHCYYLHSEKMLELADKGKFILAQRAHNERNKCYQ
ncbi:hypothetical protein [Oceanimonas smirnovii]|uniref:hypothetical protein n=1 Tax=Oceanimonas smirnovii TaxID=264574 RepID=UPI003FCFD826